MALSVWLKIGEQLQIGEATLRFERAGERRIRLSIEAPKSVNICRSNFMMPNGYRIEKLINGRFLLLEPDDNGNPTRPLAIFESRKEAQEKVEELANA